jgi:hypothetical protein
MLKKTTVNKKRTAVVMPAQRQKRKREKRLKKGARVSRYSDEAAGCDPVAGRSHRLLFYERSKPTQRPTLPPIQ